MSKHPTAEQLRLWLNEELDEARGREIEEHVLKCPGVCQPAIDRMSGFDGAPPPPALTVGGLVPPPTHVCPPGYRMIALLGRGGMGTVWRALELSTRRQVALKITSARSLGSEKSRRRFEREVDLSARLGHPGIARLYRAGLHQGVFYYAMELIDGVHLDRFAQQARLDATAIVTLMLGVCRAVEHAHQHGVIHRDLKPSNILVTPDGQAHVVDFGLARTVDQEMDKGLTISQEGDIAGTPAYMSPEQAAGRLDEVGTRTDVYSLGVILFELLTGQPPHDLSGTRFDVVQRIVNEEVRRPRGLNPKIDRELESLLLKALARTPAERYASAGALAQDLENYLSGEPLQARPATTTYFLRKRIRKYRWQVALATGVAVALLAVAVLAYARVATERRRALSALDAAASSAAKERQASAELGREVAQERRTSASLAREAYFMRIALADQMERTSNFGHADVLLDACPAPMRGWEWYHLEHQAHLNLATAQNPGHGMVRMVCYSPDGSLLAEASDHLDLVVWDAKSLKLLWSTKRDPASETIGSIAFTPDSHSLAYNRFDGGAWLCDARTGKTLRHWKDEHKVDGWAVQCMALSADGTRIASTGTDHDGGASELIRIRDVSAPVDAPPVSVLHASDYKSDGFNSTALSPDGKTLAAGMGPTGIIGLWDAQTGHWLRNTEGRTSGSISFSHRGSRLFTNGSWDHPPAVVDCDSGRIVSTFRKQIDVVDAGAFSPDDRLIAMASADGTVRTWDAATGRQLRVLRGFHRTPNTAAFSPDGSRLATGDEDGQIKIWDPAASNGDLTLNDPGPFIGLEDIALDPPGHLAYIQRQNGDISVWDVETARILRRIVTGHGAGRICIASAGPTLAVAADGKIYLQNLATGRTLQTRRARDLAYWQFALSPDARYAAIGYNDSTIDLWDLTKDDSHSQIRDASAYVDIALAFSPDSKILASTTDYGVELWDPANGRHLRHFTPREAPVGAFVSIGFSPDGSLLAAGRTSGGFHIWETQSGREVTHVDVAHASWVRTFAFTSDNRHLITGSDDKLIKYWEVQTGREIVTLAGHSTAVTRVLITPDQRRIVSVGLSSDVRIWDAGPGWPPERSASSQPAAR